MLPGGQGMGWGQGLTLLLLEDGPRQGLSFPTSKLEMMVTPPTHTTTGS